MNEKGKTKLTTLLFAALGSALMAVCSLVTIPLFIPITLQTLALYFLLFFLGGKYGSVSATLYVCLGAVGLPVFSGFSGGVGHLFSATGGFIFGFVAAALVYWGCEVLFAKFTFRYVISSALSLLSLYAVGVVWYVVGYLTVEGTLAAIVLTVLPTLLFDVLKILLAYILAYRLSKIINLKS